MPRPTDVRPLIAEYEAEAKAAAEAGDVDGAAHLLSLALVLRRAAKMAALTAGRTERTIPSMHVDTKGRSAAVKAAVARSRRKHPAQDTLYRAGVTITALAAALGETRARVSAWMADGEANRPVPVTVADRLAAGIKIGEATVRIPRTSWRRIAS